VHLISLWASDLAIVLWQVPPAANDIKAGKDASSPFSIRPSSVETSGQPLTSNAMVKYTSALFIIASIAVSAFASPLLQRDISKLKADFRDTGRAVIALDAKFSGVGATVTMSDALGIKMDVEVVEKKMNQCTEDVKDIRSVSDSDAKVLYEEAKGLAPIIEHLLNSISAKKNAFSALPPQIIPLIKGHLQLMRDRSATLGKALIKVAPNNMKADATKTENMIDDAFNKAIKIYS